MPPRSVGVIADTHGLLRPEAAEAFAGTALIIHAGDIGDPEILEALGEIAPVVAVRGNNDSGAWADRLPASRSLVFGGRRLFVLHDRNALDFDPVSRRVDAVISGHSHRPRVETRRGVLYVNPGSAGPRRFRLPVALARIEIGDLGMTTDIVTLAPSP